MCPYKQKSFRLNQYAVNLQSEPDKLTKYARSDDFIVAYHLNREMNINMKTLEIPKLNIAGIFFFGKISSPSNRWV
ncbi:MAG: hypothetical protein ACJA2B_001908, partial [Candidatus Endobugula sp.]